MTDKLIKIAGAWKSIDDNKVKIASAWKQVETSYVKIAGAWKVVWNNAVVTLSGETISDSGPSPATALVIFNTDGTVDKKEGLSTTQIDSGTDWIIPNGSADPLYEVSYTLDSGDALTDGGAAGTWVALSANRQYGYITDAPGSLSGTITVSIRFDGGATIDTGVYVLTAEEV